jgi:hypothetical protein
MMIERPEQVVHFVRTDSAPGCAIVATYDPALSFAIAQANLPEEVLISPFPPPVGQHQTQNTVCAHPTFYGVESYLGGASQWEPTLATELRNAAQAIEGGWQTHRFNFDPDAARKRRLASLRGFGGDLKSTAEIPDYRYVVVSGPIAAPSVGTVRQALKDFSNTDQ